MIMKYILKAFFRPVDNRHYTSKKASALVYALKFIPTIFIGVFGAIVIDARFWYVLGGMIIFGFIDYIVFDALADKMAWKYIWSRFYGDEVHEPTAEHKAMKKFEANPSKDNLEALHKHVRPK